MVWMGLVLADMGPSSGSGRRDADRPPAWALVAAAVAAAAMALDLARRHLAGWGARGSG